MNRMNRLYCLCLFCALYSWGGQAQNGISRHTIEEQLETEPVQQSVLQFNVADAQFRKLSEDDEPVTLEYSYVNTGDKPLAISKVTASCGCIAVEYDRQPIPAGGKGSILVSFNPKGYSGVIYRQIFVYTPLSAERPTVRLTLSGEVAPSTDPWRSYPYRLGVLRARQQSVSFRVTNRSGKMAEVIACANSSDAPLSLSVENLPSYLTFRTSSPVIDAGKEADLIFLFDGSKLPAKQVETITIPVILTGLEGIAEQRTLTVVIKLD
ncbi:DUF1573 domain-containing protein [Bacteroides oleiciplenus]|uniref:DUF1573 domain-containing protein n=1 Tax=Bacteroides oleiciplenus TaxID=626931 RepID=UPI0026DD36FF|nr:DUF1573 domain-containing protein [Bacteroides oleiciplenus]